MSTATRQSTSSDPDRGVDAGRNFDVTIELTEDEYNDAVLSHTPLKIKVGVEHVDTDDSDFNGVVMKTKGGASKSFLMNDDFSIDIDSRDILIEDGAFPGEKHYIVKFSTFVDVREDDKPEQLFETFNFKVTQVGRTVIGDRADASIGAVIEDDDGFPEDAYAIPGATPVTPSHGEPGGAGTQHKPTLNLPLGGDGDNDDDDHEEGSEDGAGQFYLPDLEIPPPIDRAPVISRDADVPTESDVFIFLPPAPTKSIDADALIGFPHTFVVLDAPPASTGPVALYDDAIVADAEFPLIFDGSFDDF